MSRKVITIIKSAIKVNKLLRNLKDFKKFSGFTVYITNMKDIT